MAEHIGGEALGAPAPATGNYKAMFDGITVDGEVHFVDLLITGTLISIAAAFNAKNPSGAAKLGRTADDLDKMLDFIFNSGSLRIDETNFAFQNELMSYVRTVLAGAEARDWEVTGALVDGTSIPISSGGAIAFGIRIPIPMSLRDEVLEEDGDQYKQGTERVKRGGWLPSVKNIAGVVALANGSATLAALSFDVEPVTDPNGDKYYSGPNWKMRSDPGLPAVVTLQTLPRAKRLFMWVDGIGAGPYTVNGAEQKTNKKTAAALISAFNRNRRRDGGDNTCARGVPLVWPRKGLKLAEMDFTPAQIYVKDESAPASQIFLTMSHETLDPAIAKRLRGQARIDNQGTNVTPSTPAPPSTHGNGVHARNASILGQGLKKA